MSSFCLKGQSVWYHDEGDESGYFHTFDALVVDPRVDALVKSMFFYPVTMAISTHLWEETGLEALS